MNLTAAEANLLYKYIQSANHKYSQRFLAKGILDKIENLLDSFPALKLIQVNPSTKEENTQEIPIKIIAHIIPALFNMKDEKEITFIEAEEEYIKSIICDEGAKWDSDHTFLKVLCALERKIKDARREG